jgi:hypothetical protein
LAGSLRVLLGPDRLDQLIAGGAAGMQREIGDQLLARAAQAGVLDAFDPERAKQRDADRG